MKRKSLQKWNKKCLRNQRAQTRSSMGHLHLLLRLEIKIICNKKPIWVFIVLAMWNTETLGSRDWRMRAHQEGRPHHNQRNGGDKRTSAMSWRYQTSHSTQHFHSNPYFTLVWMERGKKKRPSPWRHTLSLPPLSRSLGPEILSSLFAWGGSKEFYNFSQHCCRELFVFRDPSPLGADQVTLYSTSSP